MTEPDKTLLHNSIDELRDQCNKDVSICRKAKDWSSLRCLNLMESLFKKYKEMMHENKLESAYVALRRATNVSQLIMDNPDYATFQRTSDGGVFYDLVSKTIDDLSALHERLDKLYLAKRTARNCSIPASNQSPPAIEAVAAVDDEDFDKYIRPQQLIKFIENKRRNVLVLDYRTEKPKLINYSSTKFANLLTVVLLNPQEIPPGCILSMLASTVAISDRPILLNVNSFDLVVLVGDKNEVKRPLVDLPKNCCTWILLEALTTYNNTRSMLKRLPVILKDGFESWNFSYPMHTVSVEADDHELTFEDRFGKLLAAAVGASSIDVTYPSLVSAPKGPLYDDPKPKQLPPIAAQRSVVAGEGRRDFSTFPSRKSSSNASLAYPTLPPAGSIQPTSAARIPSVDRSTKPTLPAPKPTESSYPRTPTTSSSSDSQSYSPQNGAARPVPKPRGDLPAAQDSFSLPDSQHRNSAANSSAESCAAAALRESAGGRESVESYTARGLPQVQTLGGARIASADVVRPPTPDRSTKGALADFIQKDLTMFFGVYEASMNDIAERSKRGSTQPGYTGLYNLHNTCFMNATLQALFHTPGFAPLFMEQKVSKYINVHNKYGSKGVISGCFSALVDSVWCGKFAVVRPHMFLDTFANFVNRSLGDRRQHDAQEFQIYLLDALHEDTNKINMRRPFEQNYSGVNMVKDAEDYIQHSKLFSTSVVNDFFNLRMVSRLNCMTCQEASVTFEEMNQISVELPSNAEQRAADQRSVTLRDCLRRHFADVLLDGQSRWKCPRCKVPQVAGRSTRIWTLPSVLIVHMKRFSFDGGDFVKNEIDVDFDVSGLNLADYVHENADCKKTTYSLYAVTNHDGRLNSGHYTAYVKNLQTQEWLKFDDDACSRMGSNSVKTRRAFILYYTNCAPQ